MSGTASVLLYAEVIERIRERGEVELVSVEEFGDGMYQCLMQSHLIPHGYNGQMCAVVDEHGRVSSFYPDLDT